MRVLGAKTVVDDFKGVYIWPGIETWQVGASFALGCISTVAGLWVLWHMRNLFLLYKMGEVISANVAWVLQRIGGGLLLMAVLRLAIFPLQSMVLTMRNPEGQRSVSFSISSDDISLMLAGGLVLLVGWAMGEAARIAEDNRAIVAR